ncbi:tRNA lysidine(34) synthetase TilS [Dyella sp.]|uniref:tRNA lysidine(34) synthetase TilS n=1 Tax=Dyella sp. TaxID=1869338 RepID=UPI002ED6243E
MSRPKLSDTLREALEAHPDGALCVAFSGGPDSTAMLHALAHLPQARARGLRALHVDHGLHGESRSWALQCQAMCIAWDVPFKVLPVSVDRSGGEGLEAAARAARYRALAEPLQPGERLLLGHHRDDQVETVLLKLLRGAGPEGLGGMRAMRPLGAGLLWRPLLNLPRDCLRDYAQQQQLQSIEDPSNEDRRYARNRLRHEVIPLLRAHWPHASDAILHSARLSRAAADALADQWQASLAVLRDAQTQSLDAARWLALAPALREPLLAHWLHERGCTAPTTAQRAQIEQQIAAREGRVPCIRWPGTEVHIWRGRLWANPPVPDVAADWHTTWHGQPLPLPAGGSLSLTAPVALSPALTIRLRQGGEHLRPAGHAHTRELRDLFQQGAIPPWQRPGCPLIYRDDQLIAVADRWFSAEGETFFRGLGSWPVWRVGLAE